MAGQRTRSTTDLPAIWLPISSEELLEIVEGTADVYERQPAGRTQRVAQLTAGDFFGELGLPNSQPRTADVRCGPRLSLLSRADNVSCFNDRSEVHVSVTALGCPEVRGYETADGTMTLGLAYLVQGTKAI